MRDYFIRRFLLILPTLIGATMVVFGITRVVPGGPLEKAMQAALMNERSSGGKNAGAALSDEQREEMSAYYGFDKSFLPAYFTWLGVWPREEAKQLIKFEEGKDASADHAEAAAADASSGRPTMPTR